MSAYAQPIPLPGPTAGVDAWMCDLVRSDADIAHLERLLAPAEIARAARFGRPEFRNRYIVGRATLRVLLGERLQLDPVAIAIERGRRGRPFVGNAGARGL